MQRQLLRALGLLLVSCVTWAALPLDEAAQGTTAGAPIALRGASPLPLDAASRSFVDQQARLTIEQVEAADETLPWAARQAGQADRIHGKALWIQFDARVAEPQRWFIELGAAGIHRAQLFHRGSQGRWVVQQAGDAVPVAHWPVPGRFPTFALAAPGEQATRYWLRVEHKRLHLSAPLTLYRESTLGAQRQREQFLLGGFFGVATLLALAALASGIVWRDRAFLAFALYTVAVGAGQLARVGVGAQHLWPHWPFWNALVALAWPGLPVAAALWFVKVVTAPARRAPVLDWIAWILIAALLAAVAADAVLRVRTTMVVVLVLTGLALAAVVAMVVWGWLDGRDPEVKLVATGFLPVVLLALFPLARAFGLIPASALTHYGVLWGTLLTLPLLYHALQVRSMRRRESEVRAAALSHTDPLTGLPHRRSFLQRLETALARAGGQEGQFALLGVRIANLEAIASEFGDEVAQKAVVVAASHLRRVIMPTDMAARAGDDQFALLLESPITREMAISRAQQVIASGLRAAPALPAGVTLRFAVTVAMVPHQGMDAAATLQWLLGALEQVGPDARKLIRPLNLVPASAL